MFFLWASTTSALPCVPPLIMFFPACLFLLFTVSLHFLAAFCAPCCSRRATLAPAVRRCNRRAWSTCSTDSPMTPCSPLLSPGVPELHPARCNRHRSVVCGAAPCAWALPDTPSQCPPPPLPRVLLIVIYPAGFYPPAAQRLPPEDGSPQCGRIGGVN